MPVSLDNFSYDPDYEGGELGPLDAHFSADELSEFFQKAQAWASNDAADKTRRIADQMNASGKAVDQRTLSIAVRLQLEEWHVRRLMMYRLRSMSDTVQ